MAGLRTLTRAGGGQGDLAWALAGLEAEAEIRVDRWGIPHIYAASAADLFFAQGFNAARERLWQIDLWRRCGLGLLSEAFGPEYAERDRAARLFTYRGEIEAELDCYPELTRLALRRHAEGVNAFVDLALERPELLPHEFRQLDYLPGRWAAEDVVRVRSNGRHHNVAHEVARAAVLRDYGAGVERLRAPLEPDCALVVPDGLDLDSIGDDVLRLYRLATAPFGVGATQGEGIAEAASSVWGSNNWALAGSRTASGRPILANDPHRALTYPSMRYVVHLSAPGIELAGAGEPAVPGVAMGHNGRLAFGVTTFCGDQEDLYVYETDAAGDRYRYEGEWEEFRTVREALAVRGCARPEEVELRFTRHGPVVAEDPERGRAFAVRAAWLEPGMTPYLGALELLSATDWPGFAAAAERWGYPGDNLVYADTEGTIAWKPAGRFPVRPNWDGLLPVPGDGRYEWDGYHPASALPDSVDPGCGWVASANQCNVEDRVLEELAIGREWLPPFRFERIAEVLDGLTSATLQDSLALQGDAVSLPARRVLAATRGIQPEDADAAWALSQLREWDCSLDARSGPAALFEVWVRIHLGPALLRSAVERLVPPAEVEAALAALLPPGTPLTEPRPMLAVLEQPARHLGDDGEALVGEVVERTLAAAVLDLERMLGADRSAWAWGRLHRIQLEHPLGAKLPDSDPSTLFTRSAPRPGSVDTVGNTAYAKTDFKQTDGTSWRMVLDVGDWDRSLAVNYPGQSGRLGDPHQRDLELVWNADQAIPLLFSRLAVEAASVERIALAPGAGAGASPASGALDESSPPA